jgi:hypothetical protein
MVNTPSNCIPFLESDEEEDEDEDGEAEFSDGDEEPKRKRVKPGHVKQKNQMRSQRLDFSKLPELDNSGLTYLPKMRYFDVDVECPIEPVNKLEPHQELRVITYMPDGSFKCIAIPLDAVYEDEQE